MKRHNLVVIAIASLVIGSYHAEALEVTSSFGSLPGATFGGSGIPNNSVAITRVVDAGDPQNPSDGYTVTLGLTSHGRYDNPPVSNNGAGVFYGQPGANTPPGATRPGALWNFGFYAELNAPSGVTFLNSFVLELLYDTDPAPNTPDTSLGRIMLGFAAPSLIQGSENLAFSYLAADSPPYIDAPGMAFNPNVGGEYSFALVLSDLSLNELGRSSMKVVVQAPDTGTSFGLLGLGLTALAGLRRRMVG